MLHLLRKPFHSQLFLAARVKVGYSEYKDGLKYWNISNSFTAWNYQLRSIQAHNLSLSYIFNISLTGYFFQQTKLEMDWNEDDWKWSLQWGLSSFKFFLAEWVFGDLLFFF